MKIKTSELIGAALDWAVVRSNYEINFQEVWDNFRGECGYSVDWQQGGPIIEREKMGVFPTHDGWAAGMQSGPTPLIAAMRCYVASQLGDEVEVPFDVALDSLIYETGDDE